MTNEQRIQLLTQAYQADNSARELIAMVIADLEHERQGPILKEAQAKNFTEAHAAVAKEVITKDKLAKTKAAFGEAKKAHIPANHLTLDTNNYAGYPLSQCLRGMLKKWDNGVEGWPKEDGIFRQAKTFNVHFDDICMAIASNKQLHTAFMAIPETGYPEWFEQNDKGAF